jgi:hypothetical protein
MQALKLGHGKSPARPQCFKNGGFRTGGRDRIGSSTDLQPGRWWFLSSSFVGPQRPDDLLELEFELGVVVLPSGEIAGQPGPDLASSSRLFFMMQTKRAYPCVLDQEIQHLLTELEAIAECECL